MSQLPVPEEPSERTAPLQAAGWERRFIADAAQAQEAMALYTALGFEVHAEPLQPAELGPQCAECQLVICKAYVTIYTRRREKGRNAQDGEA